MKLIRTHLVLPLALTAAALASMAPTGAAQGFNIDFGSAFGTPATSYGAAAGQSGFWNTIDSFANPSALLDTAGATTPASLSWSGFHFAYSSDNALTLGDDQALMDDLLDGPGTYTISGVAAGLYDVYTYAWAPDDAQALTSVAVAGSTNGTQSVGGNWPGSHSQGTTYAKHQVTVTGAGTISITLSVASKFASLNGIQIEPGAPPCPTPVTYCTAKVNSCGGLPAISSTGIPSASNPAGFVLLSSGAKLAKTGLVIYSPNGRNNSIFQGGLLCISSTQLRRSVTAVSGGGTPGPVCDSTFSMDWSAFANGNLGGNPQGFLLVVGNQINVQWWGRDTVANGSYLSNGLEYTVCP